MSELDTKVKALRIYLHEMKEMHREMAQQNDELLQLLVDGGNKNIKDKLKAFQIKYIAGKINSILN